MFKLQISCIVILCFLLVLFLLMRKFSKATHKLYIALLIVSVLGILFEILAIYSVQQIGSISPVVFKSIHRSYLTIVLTFFYLQFRYKSAFVYEEAGMQDRGIEFIHVAQVILYAGIFLLPIGYEVTLDGPQFEYGPGIWIVYVGAVFYLLVVFSNYCEHLKKIEKDRLVPLVLGVACGMVTCSVYMCNPSTNASGIGIVIMAIAMFISIQASDACVEKDAADEAISSAEKDEVIGHIVFEASQARVLIVDDSDLNRKVLRNLLKRTKMQIEEAASGKECLELVRKNKYHLIFMDHLMPEMDGLETFESMKNEHLCEGIPVVAMTANALSMTEEDYLKLGFAAYAAKPILPEQLMVLVYNLLDKQLVTEVEIGEKIVREEQQKPEQIIEEQEKEDTKALWDELPAVDGLDYNYAALHFKDAEEFKEMVCFLVGVMRSDMSELGSYFENIGDTQQLNNFRTKVHSMKNSAMTIGIVPLAGLAKTLEDAAKDANAMQINALMPVFEEKWEKYRISLSEKFVGVVAEKTKADPSSPEIQELLRQLRKAAEDMDIDALDEIIGQLDSYAFPSEYDEKIQKIRLAVMNFDVEYLQEEGTL